MNLAVCWKLRVSESTQKSKNLFGAAAVAKAMASQQTISRKLVCRKAGYGNQPMSVKGS